MIFYGFIYLVSLVAYLSVLFPSLRRWLLSRPLWLGGFSLGQLSLCVALGCMLLGEFVYWYLDHAWQLETRSDFTAANIAARSAGQVANAVMGLLLLPAAKNNVWTLVFGVSWEEMLVWHQGLGYLFLLAVLAHSLLFWVVFAQNDSFPGDILNVPLTYHSDVSSCVCKYLLVRTIHVVEYCVRICFCDLFIDFFLF